MQNKVLETPVDKLIEIVKKNNNCSIELLRSQLNAPQEILERWLVILEEYGVINVHYRGISGYVTISNETKKESEDKKIDVGKIKDIFIEKAKIKKVSYDKMQKLWPIFVLEYEKEIRDLFEDKAKDLGYDSQRIEKAWLKYKEEITQL